MEWFTDGVIWGQSAMLLVSGYMLMDGVRLVKRQMRLIEEQKALMDEMADVMSFQQGLIAALHAGVITTWNIRPIDFRNLPVELRLRILHALIDVAVSARMEEPKHGG